jgi:hypothetical protein
MSTCSKTQSCIITGIGAKYLNGLSIWGSDSGPAPSMTGSITLNAKVKYVEDIETDWVALAKYKLDHKSWSIKNDKYQKCLSTWTVAIDCPACCPNVAKSCCGTATPNQTYAGGAALSYSYPNASAFQCCNHPGNEPQPPEPIIITGEKASGVPATWQITPNNGIPDAPNGTKEPPTSRNHKADTWISSCTPMIWFEGDPCDCPCSFKAPLNCPLSGPKDTDWTEGTTTSEPKTGNYSKDANGTKNFTPPDTSPSSSTPPQIGDIISIELEPGSQSQLNPQSATYIHKGDVVWDLFTTPLSLNLGTSSDSCSYTS